MSDELAQGGVIEPAGFTMIGNGSPETVYSPKGAQVYPNKGIETRRHAAHLPVDLSEDARELIAAMGEQDLRAFIRKEVHKALDDIANEVRTNTALQPHVPEYGWCWACNQPGSAMQWYGHHLIHKTEECRKLAAEKPEQRG